MTPPEQGSRAAAREPFFSAYVAAHEALTIFPDLGRTVIEVRGSRSVQVLNGLVTNAVEPVPTGRGCYAFMLGPKGRTIAEFRVLPAPGFENATPEEQVLWIDTPSNGVEAILAHFQKYVPPIFATYEVLDLDRVSLIGPQALSCARAALEILQLSTAPPLEDLEQLEGASLGGDGLLVRRETVEADGFDLYVPSERAEAVRTAIGAAAIEFGGAVGDDQVWEVLRVERGIPVFGVELSPDRLAQEAGQDKRAISFTKGCFTGQEVVARIHYRGHVNRVLRGLRIPESEVETVRVGTELTRGGRKVGVVCSALESPQFDLIALAYVRREVEPGDHVGTGGAAETLEVNTLPFT